MTKNNFYTEKYYNIKKKDELSLNKILLNKTNKINEYENISGVNFEFAGRKVVVFEKIRGIEFKVAFDGSRIFVRSENNNRKIVDLLNKKYMKSFGKIVQAFNQVPFTAFGVYVAANKESLPLKKNYIKYIESEEEEKLVFYDILINNNWVYSDHIEELFSKNDLHYFPKIFTGTFNIDLFKNLLNKKSVFSEFDNQPIEGIIVKLACEDKDQKIGRLIFKITNEQFKNNLILKEEEEEKEKIKKAAISAIAFLFNSSSKESITLYWKFIVRKNKIELKKINIGKILKACVKETINSRMNFIIYEKAKEEKISLISLTKEIKKILPKIIISNLELNK